LFLLYVQIRAVPRLFQICTSFTSLSERLLPTKRKVNKLHNISSSHTMSGTQNQNKSQYIKKIKEDGIEVAAQAFPMPQVPPKAERLLPPISSIYPAL